VFLERKHNQSGMDFDSRAVELFGHILCAIKVARKFFCRNCVPTICVHLCMTDVFIIALTVVVCVCVCKRARIRVHIYRVFHLCNRIGKIIEKQMFKSVYLVLLSQVDTMLLTASHAF
jgi:hypothetical protein